MYIQLEGASKSMFQYIITHDKSPITQSQKRQLSLLLLLINSNKILDRTIIGAFGCFRKKTSRQGTLLAMVMKALTTKTFFFATRITTITHVKISYFIRTIHRESSFNLLKNSEKPWGGTATTSPRFSKR